MPSTALVNCTAPGSNGSLATFAGVASADGTRLSFPAPDGPWERFSGELSGLWCSTYDSCADVYILAHNRSTDSLNVSWDCDRGLACPASKWDFATGAFDRAAMNASLTIRPQGQAFQVAVSKAFDELGFGGALGWRKRSRQLLPASSNSSCAKIKKVHMIFMNHLDVGYTIDINDVDNEYLHSYYQQVRRLALEMEAKPNAHADKFIYITHPWLMSLFLNCPCAVRKLLFVYFSCRK